MGFLLNKRYTFSMLCAIALLLFSEVRASGTGLNIRLSFDDDLLPRAVHYSITTDFESTVKVRLQPYQDTVPVADNMVNIVFNGKHPRYALFDFGGLGNKWQIRTIQPLLDKLYLLPEQGHISIAIFRDTVLFTGDGAAAFEAQYKLYELEYKASERLIGYHRSLNSLSSKGFAHQDSYEYENMLKEYLAFRMKLFRAQSALLDNYYGYIPNAISSLIEQDFWSRHHKRVLTYLFFNMRKVYASNDRALSQKLLTFYYENYVFNQPSFPCKEPSFFQSSFHYQQSLYDWVMPLLASGFQATPTFEQLYGFIIHKYDGKMRDHVLGHLISQTPKEQIPEWGFSDMMQHINNNEVKHFLKRQMDEKLVGQRPVDFVLSDTSGNRVALKDFEGKVVVLDFWYTGCLGCATLAKQMKPIVDHYRNDASVLFVSISIDRDFELWKKSVSSHIYTHDGGIDLYTEGLGSKHRLISFFDITSYPKLVILDKNGKILSADPPRPSLQSPVNTLKIKEIIDKAGAINILNDQQ
ncbi:MAG TPA: thioredoxin family protein [Parapedobacter sp.]|nr:thioredoxin family protein [Parapedobacter sp.]